MKRYFIPPLFSVVTISFVIFLSFVHDSYFPTIIDGEVDDSPRNALFFYPVIMPIFYMGLSVIHFVVVKYCALNNKSVNGYYLKIILYSSAVTALGLAVSFPNFQIVIKALAAIIFLLSLIFVPILICEKYFSKWLVGA